MKRLTAFAAATAVSTALAVVPEAQAITTTVSTKGGVTTCTFQLTTAEADDYLAGISARLTADEIAQARDELYHPASLTPDQARDQLDNVKQSLQEAQKGLTQAQAIKDSSTYKSLTADDKTQLDIEIRELETKVKYTPRVAEAYQACADGKDYNSEPLGTTDNGVPAAKNDGATTAFIVGGVLAGIAALVAVALPALKQYLPAPIAALLP